MIHQHAVTTCSRCYAISCGDVGYSLVPALFCCPLTRRLLFALLTNIGFLLCSSPQEAVAAPPEAPHIPGTCTGPTRIWESTTKLPSGGPLITITTTFTAPYSACLTSFPPLTPLPPPTLFPSVTLLPLIVGAVKIFFFFIFLQTSDVCRRALLLLLSLFAP